MRRWRFPPGFPQAFGITGSWLKEAACAGKAGEVNFFPATADQSHLEKARVAEAVAAAKRVCAGCTVLLECQEFALENRVRHGIWGGMTEDEREMMRKRRAV